MQCPQCTHQKSIKSGRTRGKQRRKCKKCGHQFVESPQPVGAPSKGTAPPCPYCDKGILHKRSARGQRLYYQCRNPECQRFSTYELIDGQLVHVKTRKAQPPDRSKVASAKNREQEEPKMLEFYEWLDGKRLSRTSCRVVGEDRTGNSLNCKAYALKNAAICHPGQLPIRPVVYWECPEKLSALDFFAGLIEHLDYPSSGKQIYEKRQGLYEALRRSEVEMLILDEAERLSLRVLSELPDFSNFGTQ